MDQRRSALYIDFDNFFGGLLRSDPQAAVRIAERPQVWIEGLTNPEGAPSRRWLQLRCYLNPGGSVPHPTEPGQRILILAGTPFGAPGAANLLRLAHAPVAKARRAKAN